MPAKKKSYKGKKGPSGGRKKKHPNARFNKPAKKDFVDQHADQRCESVSDVKRLLQACKAEVTRVEEREKGRQLLITFKRNDGRTESIQFRKNRLPTKLQVRKAAKPKYRPRKGQRPCDLARQEMEMK